MRPTAARSDFGVAGPAVPVQLLVHRSVKGRDDVNIVPPCDFVILGESRPVREE